MRLAGDALSYMGWWFSLGSPAIAAILLRVGSSAAIAAHVSGRASGQAAGGYAYGIVLYGATITTIAMVLAARTKSSAVIAPRIWVLLPR